MALTNVKRVTMISALIVIISIFYGINWLENSQRKTVHADNTDNKELGFNTNNRQSYQADVPTSFGDENIIQSSIVIAQPVPNETHQHFAINHQVLLVKLKNLLQQTLTPQEALALIEESPDKAANEITDNEALLVEVLNKITELAHGEQREYLLRAVNAINPELRKQASYELLASARIIDRNNGVALMMSLPESYEKITQTQLLLQTETNTEVLKTLLHHLSSEDDKDMVLATFNELQNIVDFSQNLEIKALALHAMMKVAPASLEITAQVTKLIDSQEIIENYHGLNILHHQLNDFAIPLTAMQKDIYQEQLVLITKNTKLPTDNRIKAQSTLDILAQFY